MFPNVTRKPLISYSLLSLDKARVYKKRFNAVLLEQTFLRTD